MPAGNIQEAQGKLEDRDIRNSLLIHQQQMHDVIALDKMRTRVGNTMFVDDGGQQRKRG